jgi:4-hydroxybenzoate polyprenyltransferase/phosphoserine phosphatase
MNTSRSNLSEVGSANRQGDAQYPLCVDLDGTLCLTNTLEECVVKMLRVRPLLLLLLPFWAIRGKAYLKARVAAVASPAFDLLPYHPEILNRLRERRDSGLETVLATGAAEKIAHGVSGELRLFDRVLSSTGDENLVGRRKADRLAAEFGAGRYLYVGDSTDDLAVWKHAAGIVAIEPSQRLRRQLAALGREPEVIARPSSVWKAVAKSLRVHQWTKNLLVFVPLLMSHRISELELLVQTVIAFFAFSLCGSSAYLLNDLCDLEADRKHPVKRARPFASGAAPLWTGLLLSPLFLGAGLTVAALGGMPLLAVVASYSAATFLYSLSLRGVLVLDVIVLALLYTARIVGGVAATGVEPSNWLFAFSGFLFLGLALMKRYADIGATSAGRAYRQGDAAVVQMTGVCSSLMALLVLSLYIEGSRFVHEYGNPAFLWAWVPLLAYYLIRMWITASRGEMNTDPILFAIRDRSTYVIGVLGLLVLWLALVS